MLGTGPVYILVYPNPEENAMGTPKEIGAYDAKTHLPEILRKVQAGGSFVITQRGRPIADLSPIHSADAQKTSAAAGRMRVFMDERPAAAVDIKALIEEGRD